MKGYAEILMGWVLMLVIFVIVNSYLTTRMTADVSISDAVADSYRVIDAIEFAKLNVKQDLKFSIEETKKDLKIVTIGNKEEFLKKLKANFHPSHGFSEVDVSVLVNSINIDGSNLVANITFASSSDFRKALSTTFITQPLE